MTWLAQSHECHIWVHYPTQHLSIWEMQLALRYYRKIPKISLGAYIFQRPFLRGLSAEGNLRFKINWASLIVRSKLTVFAFFFAFEGNFPSTRHLEGRFNEGFCVTGLGGLYLEGLIHRGAYFLEFYSTSKFLQHQSYNFSRIVFSFSASLSSEAAVAYKVSSA